MQIRGHVVAVEGVRATVCVEPNESCRSCEAGKLCPAAGTHRLVVAENSIGARVGDEVCVEQAAAAGLLAASLLFGLPVMLAVIGLLVARRCREPVIMIAGITGFCAGLLGAKIVNDRLKKKGDFLPRIAGIIGHNSP